MMGLGNSAIAVPRSVLTGFFLLALMIFPGCTPKEPPNSDAAISFKKEALNTIGYLSPLLADPLSRDDIAGVTKAAKAGLSGKSAINPSLDFRFVVLDKNGVEIAGSGTDQKGEKFNFSNYRVVDEPLNKQKMAQARLYVQGGEKIFVIGSPLVFEKNIVGVLVIGLTMEEVQREWGVSEEEFLLIDFNR